MPTDPVDMTAAAPPVDSLDLQGIRLHAETDVGPAEASVVEPDAGLLEIHVTAAATLTLDWDLPAGGATVYWQPWYGRECGACGWAVDGSDLFGGADRDGASGTRSMRRSPRRVSGRTFRVLLRAG